MALDFDVSPLKKLLETVAGDATLPVILWQLGVAATALALGYFAARIICQQIQPSPRWKFGEGDFGRVAFPLLAYVFVALGRLILQKYQSVALLEVLQALLVAWVVIRIAVYILGHVLPPGGFLRGSIRTIAWVAWIAVALHLTGLLPSVIGTLDEVGLTVGKDKERVTLWLAMQAISALAIALTMAAWISRITASRVLAAQHMEMSTRIVITKAVHVTTLFLAILIALPLVGIPITALSIFSGALGVGLGFGLQKIASNYVSGFIVLLDKSLRIGDVITVDNRKGEVKAIETRYTVIKSGDGVESIIPNEKLITEIVNHHTYSDSRVTVVLPLVVSFESDMDAVLGLLLQAAAGDNRVLTDPSPFARIKAFRDHGAELELTVWIDNPGIDAEVRSDLYRTILRGLRDAGVEIARPRQDLRLNATLAMQNKADESMS